MRLTKNKKNLLASELVEIREQMKKLKKRESEIVMIFKDVMSPNEMQAFGSISIMQQEFTRSTLDKDQLINRFGADVIETFMKVSKYTIIKVFQKKEHA